MKESSGWRTKSFQNHPNANRERLKTAPNKTERLETLSTNISIQLIFSAFVSFIVKEFQQFISLLCALVIASLVSGWCGLALLLELGVFMRKTFIIWKCILFSLLSLFFFVQTYFPFLCFFEQPQLYHVGHACYIEKEI